MSNKISELKLHLRNRKLPPAIQIGKLKPEFLSFNLSIYDSLKDDMSNYTGHLTAEERHENAVAGVSTGEDVYKLEEFYNQIHTNKIQLNENNLNVRLHNTRYAILDSGHDLEYHMDPPNIFNILIPLSDRVLFKAHKNKTTTISQHLDIGEIWFVNPSYMHMTSHKSNNPRVAILANFNYNEEVYERLRRLL